MELNITKQEKQPLLSRTEITAEINFEGATPSRYEIVGAISKKLKLKLELTLVKHIYTEFGSNHAEIEAYVYDDKKVMEVLEKKIREVKEPKKVEPKAEPAPVVETPEGEAAPVEEKQADPEETKPEPTTEEKPVEEPAKESSQEKPTKEEIKPEPTTEEKPVEEPAKEAEAPAKEE